MPEELQSDFYNVYLAMEAYQAYCESVSWVSFRGEPRGDQVSAHAVPLPTWNKLQDHIKRAWDEAAHAVRIRVTENRTAYSVDRHDAGGTAPSGDVNRDFVAEIRSKHGPLLARYFLYDCPLPLLSKFEQSRTYYLYDSHGTSQHVPTDMMVITRIHGAEIEEPERNEA